MHKLGTDIHRALAPRDAFVAYNEAQRLVYRSLSSGHGFVELSPSW